jgi:hypothetical protein
MVNAKLVYRFFTPIIVLCLIVLTSSCDNISNQWHEYNSKGSEVLGRFNQDVKVVSHRWKIIEKLATESCEWGWEVTVSVHSSEKDANSLVIIDDIEYILQDKDGFDLVSSQLDKDKYNILVFDDGRRGGVIQDYSKTVTYRQTAEIPLRQAKRAAFGKCRLVMEW